jgi:hypothetical protein
MMVVPVHKSTAEQSKGLESLLYEMVILASALLLRDKRAHFATYPRLQWGAAQIALDVIRLKCRLLIDFFATRREHPDDMVCTDFHAPGWRLTISRDNRKRRIRFRRQVNPRTMHLSWTRVTGPAHDKADRELMEQITEDLLSQADGFVIACVHGGLPLTAPAEAHHENFKRLFKLLSTTKRAEEGKEKPARPRINLESLA